MKLSIVNTVTFVLESTLSYLLFLCFQEIMSENMWKDFLVCLEAHMSICWKAILKWSMYLELIRHYVIRQMRIFYLLTHWCTTWPHNWILTMIINCCQWTERINRFSELTGYPLLYSFMLCRLSADKERLKSQIRNMNHIFSMMPHSSLILHPYWVKRQHDGETLQWRHLVLRNGYALLAGFSEMNKFFSSQFKNKRGSKSSRAVR